MRSRAMENYSKGRNEEEPLDLETIGLKIPNLPKNVLWMNVKGGSKIKNLLNLAFKAYGDDKRDLLWTGVGPALSKAITCAEMSKRQFSGIHQYNHIGYRRCKEYWDSRLEGLDQLVVDRDVPLIHILLSHQPINEDLPGYQKQQEALEDVSNKKSVEKRKSQPRKHLNSQQMDDCGHNRFDKRKPKKPKGQQHSSSGPAQPKSV